MKVLHYRAYHFSQYMTSIKKRFLTYSIPRS